MTFLATRIFIWLLTNLAKQSPARVNDPQYARDYSQGKSQRQSRTLAWMSQETMQVIKRAYHPDLQGITFLDAAGGEGHFSRMLLENGASTGYLFDLSPHMLRLAQDNLRDFPAISLWQASLSEELPLTDGSIDMILCSQALHYVEDWDPISRGFHRVLTPGGHLFIVTGHPAADIVYRGLRSYFQTEQLDAFLTTGGRLIPLSYWRRSLQDTLSPFFRVGFQVADLVEPLISDTYINRRRLTSLQKRLYQIFPPFLICVLRKP